MNINQRSQIISIDDCLGREGSSWRKLRNEVSRPNRTRQQSRHRAAPNPPTGGGGSHGGEKALYGSEEPNIGETGPHRSDRAHAGKGAHRGEFKLKLFSKMAVNII